MTTGRSRCPTAATSIRPSPGQANTVSVRGAPTRRSAWPSPITVTTGSGASCTACVRLTVAWAAECFPLTYGRTGRVGSALAQHGARRIAEAHGVQDENQEADPEE